MTTFLLKVLAALSMLCDHTGAVLMPGQLWMRYIGRLAFPIYAFLIVEGYVHTRDVRKYLLRLGAFALISEIPFDLAFRGLFFAPDYQNVFFTLFLGLLALVLMERFPGNIPAQALICAALGFTAQEFHTDYRFIGVLLIVLLYVYRDLPILRFVGAAIILVPFSSRIEYFALLSFVPITAYNGRRGKFSMKYLFYLYYPLHLMALVTIRRLQTGSWTY